MKFLSFFVLFVLVSSGTADWANSARFENFIEYFHKLIQELIYEMEDHGWWNFKLNDQFNAINEAIYDRTFQGQVNYTNGFLVSVENIDMTNIQQSFLQSPTTFVTNGNMVCRLNLYDVVVGYDVVADIGEDIGTHKFTGIYNHDNIVFDLYVTQNLNTTEITATVLLTTLSAGSGNFMTYLPDTDIGEVLSRHYTPSSTWDGISSWAGQFMQPKLLEIINRTDFPKVCFNCA